MSFTNQKRTTIVQIILFFSILFAQLAIAEEQTVSVDAEVSESSGLFHWLYSESTKTSIVGTVMTLLTILLGIGVYYLIKLW